MFEILGNVIAVIAVTFVLAFWISGAFDDHDENM
jgi:hypothetical protein